MKTTMSKLRDGDEFIGPDGRTRYRVTRDMRSHPRGWLGTRDLSMTDAQARRAVKDGSVEPGCDPRDGFFAYSTAVTVERVTR